MNAPTVLGTLLLAHGAISGDYGTLSAGLALILLGSNPTRMRIELSRFFSAEVAYKVPTSIPTPSRRRSRQPLSKPVLGRKERRKR